MPQFDAESLLYKSLSAEARYFLCYFIPWFITNQSAKQPVQALLFVKMPALKERFAWDSFTDEQQTVICIEYIMVGIYLRYFNIRQIQEATNYVFLPNQTNKTNLTMTLGGAL